MKILILKLNIPLAGSDTKQVSGKLVVAGKADRKNDRISYKVPILKPVSFYLNFIKITLPEHLIMLTSPGFTRILCRQILKIN